ncbi:MAG: DUF6171 family protein [Planctomycetota bacterium]|jgi:hypothetical protein
MHVICTCDWPAAYPFRCDCLGLDILSPEMHTICRAEPLLINGQPRGYDRAVMLAAWRRSQSPETRRACCSEDKPTLRGAVRGVIGMARAYTGIGQTDRATAEARYRICQACPHNDLGQCRVCGCFVAAKVRNHDELCPSQKW